MPDRNLREQGLAIDGRMSAIESKQRVMATRVWPGAMRTATADSFTPVTPSQFSSMIDVVTLPGRWLVMGQFDLVSPSSALGVAFEFRLFAFDAISGKGLPDGSEFHEELLPSGEFGGSGGPITYDFPTYYYESAVTSAMRIPVTLIGDFANEGDLNVNVSMQCREVRSASWSVSNLRLKVIPR